MPSQQNLNNIQQPEHNQEIGYVISSRGYLAFLDGLPSAKINDIIQDENGVKALVNSLETNHVEALILDEGVVTPGQQFKNTNISLNISAGDFLLGRTINPLGIPIDGRGLLGQSLRNKPLDLEQAARGIDQREFLNTQLVTGITLIDNLVPLGKGQRELVMGDANSGMSDFLTNIIVNQKQSEVICIYAAIGKPANQIKNLINVLNTNNALVHTIVVASSATETPPLIFLTPKTALSIAQYFQQLGKDVLVILDDMGNHAKTHREISLLASKSPGRESYPGDIFYQQAHLLERAGKFNSEAGNGSITALPVIQLNLNDFTGFIPTNLMAITDGHLLFKSNLYNKNQRPAIDISLSVSRVGRQTQKVVNNTLSRRIRQVLASAGELEALARFSTELPPQTQLILRQKALIDELIKQDDLSYIPLSVQTILLALIFTTFLKDKNDTFMRKHKDFLIKSFSQDPSFKNITDQIANMKNDEELINALEGLSGKLNELCK